LWCRPETAQDTFGMQVYVTDDYTEGVSLRNAFLEENRRVSATLRNNQFKLVEKHKIQGDK